MLVWQRLAAIERRAVRDPVRALSRRAPCAILRQPYRHFQSRHKQGGITVKSEETSCYENRNRPPVEAIDNAIEQAEDLGLTFASIWMMARLEGDQSILMTRARRGNDKHA